MGYSRGKDLKMCLMMILIEKRTLLIAILLEYGVSMKRTDRKTYNLRGLKEEKKLYF